jgi:hypothetical protein
VKKKKERKEKKSAAFCTTRPASMAVCETLKERTSVALPLERRMRCERAELLLKAVKEDGHASSRRRGRWRSRGVRLGCPSGLAIYSSMWEWRRRRTKRAER